MPITRLRRDPHAWVDAAPFRAHLTHLVSSTGVDWQVIALHAGLPLPLGARLAGCSGERPLRRLPRSVAARLYSVTPEAIRSLAFISEPAEPTGNRLRLLARRGWDSTALRAATGLSDDELDAVAAGRARWVPVATALAVRALVAASDRSLARAACSATAPAA